MSIDTVDDLHAAEDRIGGLVALVRDLANETHRAHARSIPPGQPGAAFDEWAICTHPLCRAAQGAVAVGCRPSCQAEGPRARCESEDPETCGCPCHDHAGE